LIPRIVGDKGAALNYIKRQAGPFDVCVCLGDHRTDESMLRANRDQVNIKVGPSQGTEANYVVSGQEDVASVLLQIASY
jgi:trehalose-6-phosphatase